MNTRELNYVNEMQEDTDVLLYADALLDQVDTAQQQVQDIQNDISLLQTVENALDLISDNMAKVRRLSQESQRSTTNRHETSAFADEILNLLMVNMLICEETEFNGHLLFKDDVISMCSCATGELTLATTKIPEICGVETGDYQTTMDSLDNAARTINRQYQRIADVMRTLLGTYQQLRCEIDLLLHAQTRLSN